jgi:predicted ATPase
VGRAGPLATLRRTFRQAQSGQTQVVLLEGEAGVGKTRLAEEFLAWARTQGADVLAGRAFAAEGGLPYGPVAGALRPYLEQENAPDDLLADVWLAELARLLPELRERYPDLPATGEEITLGQGRLYEAVARLGLRLAARRPLVVFLDDVQWTDAGTRDLVRYAVQRWAESGVGTLVLLAARAEDLGTQRALAHWLGSLERAVPTTRLALERLAPADVVGLVATLAGAAAEQPGTGAHAAGEEDVVAFGAWLAEKTGGLPFFVTQLLQALVDEGVLRLHPLAEGGFALEVSGAVQSATALRCGSYPPAGVRALITAHVARLEEAEEELLAAATVLGDSFSAEQALEVAAVDTHRGEKALDQLVQRRLLREVPGTDTYTMGHDLVREALYAGLGEVRRRRLHRRALAVLERERAPETERARHTVAAGLVGRDE